MWLIIYKRVPGKRKPGASGKYKMAIAVLDPAGGLPSLRFTIENYINRGRHPVGFIGMEYKIKKGEVGSLKFDDSRLDRSLRYQL